MEEWIFHRFKFRILIVGLIGKMWRETNCVNKETHNNQFSSWNEKGWNGKRHKLSDLSFKMVGLGNSCVSKHFSECKLAQVKSNLIQSTEIRTQNSLQLFSGDNPGSSLLWDNSFWCGFLSCCCHCCRHAIEPNFHMDHWKNWTSMEHYSLIFPCCFGSIHQVHHYISWTRAEYWQRCSVLVHNTSTIFAWSRESFGLCHTK